MSRTIAKCLLLHERFLEAEEMVNTVMRIGKNGIRWFRPVPRGVLNFSRLNADFIGKQQEMLVLIRRGHTSLNALLIR